MQFPHQRTTGNKITSSLTRYSIYKCSSFHLEGKDPKSSFVFSCLALASTQWRISNTHVFIISFRISYELFEFLFSHSLSTIVCHKSFNRKIASDEKLGRYRQSNEKKERKKRRSSLALFDSRFLSLIRKS